MFLWTTLILSLIFTVVSHCPRADPPRKLITPEIDEYIKTVLRQWNMTGLALAIVRKDPSSPTGWHQEHESYGIARADGTPTTPDTVFAIASNSKLFTALSIGLLISNESLRAERGKDLVWSTKAGDVFGDLWGLMDEYASHSTTIQDMLSHRTGIPRHDGALGRTEGGLAEKISKLRHLRPSAEHREIFQYNNLMYDSLGYILEITVNRSLASYVEEHLFSPLNMTSSTYSIAEAEEGPIAHGFLFSNQGLKEGIEGIKKEVVPYSTRPGREDDEAGSGGVFSSARDMSTWVSMLLAIGTHPRRNQTIVPANIVEHVATGASIISSRSGFPEISATLYGGGQSILSYRGHEVIEHGGNLLGFTSQISRMPADNLGIVLLNNDWLANAALNAIKWRIVDEHVIKALVPGSPIIDWNSRFLDLRNNVSEHAKSLTTRPPTANSLSLPISELGRRVYAHPTYGMLRPCLVPTPPLRGREASQEILACSIDRCSTVLGSPPVQRILNLTDLSASTFIIPFQGSDFTHLRLRHSTGNVFNATVIFTNAEVRLKEGLGSVDEEGRWADNGDVVFPLQDFWVEWVTDGDEEGLSFGGNIWGMGAGAKEPSGVGKAGAEVWFSRVP